MSKVDLVSRGWCDIVFEGRNKEYGAYRLLARDVRSNVFAVICLLALIAAIGSIVGI